MKDLTSNIEFKDSFIRIKEIMIAEVQDRYSKQQHNIHVGTYDYIKVTYLIVRGSRWSMLLCLLQVGMVREIFVRQQHQIQQQCFYQTTLDFQTKLCLE